MRKTVIYSAIMMATLSGCQLTSVAEVCPASTRVDLAQAEVPAVGSANAKVLVIPANIEFDDHAKARIQKAITSSIEDQIDEAGRQIVDRKTALKLKDEIILAEQSGRYNTKGIPVADYAVITDINYANFSKHFSEASTTIDLDGNLKYVPPACRFEAEVKANTRIVTLPDMKTVENIQFVGSEYQSTETRNSSCPFSKEQYQGLVTEAAKNAILRNDKLKNILAPSGSVVEMRQCEVGTMVKVDMGSDNGVTPDWEMKFVTREKVAKVDGDGFEIETHGYGEGTVVNNAEHGIKPNYSWVVIDEEMAPKVRRGDTVKASFENLCNNSIFGSVGILSKMCHQTNETLNGGI
ncbi:hypothetical protein VV869_07480 [Photobacterium sp. MCCC 1A19761]|uniref:hypothetical protein n=1 Tax=Photobacterium sp. MCCC 1A19761 TaxID=3115000 RepID=UPI00307ECE8B